MELYVKTTMHATTSLAVGHGDELPYVFHTTKKVFGNPSENEKDLEEKMTIYWTNFAHHGNPNDPSHCDSSGINSLTEQSPQKQSCEAEDGSERNQKWPEYTTNQPKIMVFASRKNVSVMTAV